jgi:choline dehydrogenase-like flavoprotein|tara:strand:+ start:7695 stop:7844 length:150 start_codon:yes stop_codon:yes gene_type:complete
MVALLRAYGIASLRIANASLMPPIISGNTNEPINTIGKKAAAIVVEEAA